MRVSVPLIVLLLALSGCASQSVRIHSLPPETPAADNAAAIKRAQALAAEAANVAKSAQQGAAEEPPVAPVTPADAPPMETYDPWGRLNRFIYRFNARFDEAIFLPVANDYRRLPSPMRSGVHNFFGNLAEVDSIDQLRPARAFGPRRTQPRTVRDQQHRRYRWLIRRSQSLAAAQKTDGVWDDAVEVGHASGSVPGHSVVRPFDLA